MLKGNPKSARTIIDRLVFHPDSSLHLAALLWKRYQTDTEFRQTEIRRMGSINGDHPFIKNAHRFWALSLACSKEELIRVEASLNRFRGSKSEVVTWHVEELIERCRAAIV